MKPYISVTGFMTPSNVTSIEVPKIDGYDIFFGVFCNHLTLSNLGCTSCFPSMNDFERTLNQIERKENCHPVVHYCFGDNDVGTIEDDINSILRHPIHALQLNTASPKAFREAVHMVARCTVVPHLIFQLNLSMLNRFDLDASRVFRLFSASVPVNETAYVLLDLSGGRGRPLDYDTGIAVRNVCKHFDNLEFAVAGGVRPELVGEVLDIMGPNVGVSAETYLRRHDNDSLCPVKVNAYLSNAAIAAARLSRKAKGK